MIKIVLSNVSSRRGFCAAGFGLTLAGCGPSGFSGPRGDAPVAVPTTPVAAAPAGETLGSGPVRIALIAPLTREGGAKTGVGQALRNAVELAMTESRSNDVTILVKDDQSTPAGAQAAAQAAINEGAELIIGPLLADSVREAGQVARAANRPVIAFSSVAAVASRGVYLLSFLIENDVDRIINFAAARGKKSIAALIPETEYGNIAAAAFQTAAARDGLRVMALERYKQGAPKEAITRIAALGAQIDSLFIADQADAMASVARDLQAAQLTSRQTQILGVSAWNDARALKLPALQGAWFPAPENAGFNAFSQRYQAKYGAAPPRIATLAYDATTLAIALARAQGGQRYSESVLTNPSGFNGADGVFRFRAEGLNDRGLSVLQISNGGASVVEAAPRSFANAPS